MMITDEISFGVVAKLDMRLIGIASATINPEQMKKLILSNFAFKKWVDLLAYLIIQPPLLFDLILVKEITNGTYAQCTSPSC